MEPLQNVQRADLKKDNLQDLGHAQTLVKKVSLGSKHFNHFQRHLSFALCVIL